MPHEVEAQVLCERIGHHIAVVTLNRPEARNAVNGAVTSALEALTVELENDPQIRVIVLAANGPFFCAGVDLKVVAEGRILDVARPETGFAGFIYARKSKPWIAAVQGGAFGGGVELALGCDMIVAGEEAQFVFPEVKRGLIAGAAGAYRITRCLSRPLAIEMVVTGEPVSAQRAYEGGLVNRVVPAGKELEEALRLAEIIARNSPVAVRETLRLTRFAADLNEAELREAQDQAVANILAAPDYVEGAKAFVERRPPVWAD